ESGRWDVSALESYRQERLRTKECDLATSEAAGCLVLDQGGLAALAESLGTVEALLPGVRGRLRRSGEHANVPRGLLLEPGLVPVPASAPPAAGGGWLSRRVRLGGRRQLRLLGLRLGLGHALGDRFLFPQGSPDDRHRVRGLLRLLEGGPAER